MSNRLLQHPIDTHPQSPDKLGQTRCLASKYMPHRSSARSKLLRNFLLIPRSLARSLLQAASHSKKGWETFTTAVLKTIIDRLAPTGAEQGAKGVVFLAWGAPAGKLCVGISEVRPQRRFI